MKIDAENQKSKPSGMLGKLRQILIAAVTASIAFACLSFQPRWADAHEWMLGGQPTEAEVIGLEGELVTFRTAAGRQLAVSIQDLNDKDMSYLQAVVELSNHSYQRRMERLDRAMQLRQTQIQLEQFRSQWYDLWVVQMVSPRGEYFWWAYPVRNSYQAQVRAETQFPAAHIVGIAKLNRRTGWR